MKLVRFIPYKDSREIWHIFVGKRWRELATGPRFAELLIDTKCYEEHVVDARAKAKVEFADYDKKKHKGKMCEDCIKKLKANRPIPIARLRSFHEE